MRRLHIFVILLVGVIQLAIVKVCLPMTTEENFSPFDRGLIADWVYDTVTADHDIDKFIEVVETALNSALSDKIPPVSEAEIKRSTKINLDAFKMLYNRGDITQEEYDDAFLEYNNKNIIRNNIIKASINVRYEDGIAACELLVAVMGVPTTAFEDGPHMIHKKFKNKYNKLLEKYDGNKLKILVPKAVNVIRKLNSNEVAEFMGFYHESDQERWLNSIKEIDEKLMAVAK